MPEALAVSRGCPSRRNEHLIDSVEIHIQHFETEPFPFKMLARRWNMLQMHHHEATQGLLVLTVFVVTTASRPSRKQSRSYATSSGDSESH